MVMDLQPELFKDKYERVFGKLEKPIFFGLSKENNKPTVSKAITAPREKTERERLLEAEQNASNEAAKLKKELQEEKKKREKLEVEARRKEELVSYVSKDKSELYFKEVEIIKKGCKNCDCEVSRVVYHLEQSKGDPKKAAEMSCRGPKSWF